MKLYTGKIRRYRRMMRGHKHIQHLDNYTKTLRPGALINTCRSYNEVIKEVEWEYRYIRNNRYLVNATIVAEDGSSCSLYGCCCPAQPKEEIIKDFTEMGEEAYRKFFDEQKALGWCKDIEYENTISARLFRGEDVFDDRGCLIRK